MPLVSICIPAYKQIIFLKKCINSILIQSFTDYELIITDDTPDDTVKKFLQTILINKPYIYYKNSPSLGSPANWNKAISLATGKYIKIMHHDDFFYNEYCLAQFVTALEINPNCNFAFSNSEVINPITNYSFTHKPTTKQLQNLKNNGIHLFLVNFIGAPSATIFKVGNHPQFNENLKWLVDVDFYIQILNNTKFIYINKSLVKTTNGAQHQVTQQSLNNPKVEIFENCLVFEKLTISKDLEPLFINYFSELFFRFDINSITDLKKYAPFVIETQFYNSVFFRTNIYKKKKNRKRIIKSMLKNTLTIGLFTIYKSIKTNRKIKKQLKAFKISERNTKSRFLLKLEDEIICVDDNTINTGFDRHYVYHLAWAARVLKQINLPEHTDISSLLYFPTILSAFIKVNFYDFRPAQLSLDNLSSNHCDLTNLQFEDNSLQSLSCMHTVEHIGLGRYGDPIDYDGDLKAINELKRVVKVGGNLLFVVPIGKARIQYNAHRIYNYDQIINYFSEFYLNEFTLIPDNEAEGGLIRNANKIQSNMQNYGCGCFWFIKK